MIASEPPETKSALDLLKVEETDPTLPNVTQDLTSNSKNRGNFDFFKKICAEIAPGTIFEVTGHPGSGKTQLVYYLCAITCNKSVNCDTIFISTNKNFAPHRFKEIAEEVSRSFHQFDVEEFCDRIYFNEALTYLELLGCLHNAKEIIERNSGKFRLVAIDSISFPLKTLDGNDRGSAIHVIFRILRHFTETCNLSVIVINDLTTSIVTDGAIGQTSSFGNSFYHYVNSRLEMSKTGDVFSGQLSKSVHRPVEVLQFQP